MTAGHILDTNILSELQRRRPEPKVLNVISTLPATSLYISVIVLGELLTNALRLLDGNRRSNLLHWIEATETQFSGKILPVDLPVAKRWGSLKADLQTRGKSIETSDGLIAASALEHNFAVVTRNVRHFESTDVTIINPWDS